MYHETAKVAQGTLGGVSAQRPPVADSLNGALQRLGILIEVLENLNERVSGNNSPKQAKDAGMPSLPLVQVPETLHRGLDIATELVGQLRSQLV